MHVFSSCSCWKTWFSKNFHVSFSYHYYYCIEISISKSVVPDEMLHSAASELGSHCLHILPKRVSGQGIGLAIVKISGSESNFVCDLEIYLTAHCLYSHLIK